MKLSWILLASFAVMIAENSADVVSAHGSDGSSFVSTGTADGDKYYGQWTIGELTCYIAKDKDNGVVQTVKQCRRGLLGLFHAMTKEEEEIIEGAIQKAEAEKKLMHQKIAEGNALMQSSMRSMNDEMQKSLQGMHAYMGQMQNMMQQQMQHAFGAFG